MTERKIERICDYREGQKLQLQLTDDGDVIVCVLPVESLNSFESVQFCASGTQSPRTQKALHELYKSMMLDQEENPHEPNDFKKGI
jgi:hypothetical protein